MLELKEEWLKAVKSLVPSMDVFAKGIKKANPHKATVTPSSQAKLTKAQIEKGVWVPLKLARNLLLKSNTVNAVWKMRRQVASTLSD